MVVMSAAVAFVAPAWLELRHFVDIGGSASVGLCFLDHDFLKGLNLAASGCSPACSICQPVTDGSRMGAV